ncbi:MAG TPA: aminoglycoside adenylyltransferase domain-containing protein [Candidatus Baltobacteraceae bacterium]|nr:aminoglycoside adenylyltransferase domain-containing protein [Candidatus Baltobacteraceae bacterium]
MNDRAQSVTDADRDIRQYLIRVAGVLGDTLGERLVGVYVHGSLATGVFRRERSDIDLLAVVRRPMDTAERAALARTIVRLSDARPVQGDIEITVMAERDARSFEYPTPYELQYSAAYHEAFRRGSFDFAAQHVSNQLAVDILETRERGFVLFGPPPADLFAFVPWHAYIASLREDFDWGTRHIIDAPVYSILNACRVLHGVSSLQPSVLNKDEAARWALNEVPIEHQSTILDALNLYRGEKTADDVVLTLPSIEALRAYVLEKARPAFDRATDDGDDDDE